MRWTLVVLFLVACTKAPPPADDASAPAPTELSTPRARYAKTEGRLELVVDGKPLAATVDVATTARHALQILASADEPRGVEILLNLPLREGNYPVVTTDAFVGLDGGSKVGNAMVMYTEGFRSEATWSGTSGSVDIAFGKGSGMLVTLKDVRLAPRTYPPTTNTAKGTKTLTGTVDSRRLTLPD